MTLPISQKEAWLKLRDKWAKLLADSGGSYENLIQRGAPREYVNKWQSDRARWVEAGVPWKILLGGPASVAAQMLAWSAKERWELAAIDDLDPTTLDIALNEIQGTQNAVNRKAGKPENEPRITAPADTDPYVKLAQLVVDVSPDSLKAPGNKGAPKPGEGGWGDVLPYLTVRNVAIAAGVVVGVQLLGPTLAASVGAYSAARAKNGGKNPAKNGG